MTDEPKVTILSAQVPVELAEALRRQAESNERSVSAEVRLALRAHVAEPGPDLPAAA